MSHNTPAYRGRSAAFGAAMEHSAKKRQCPECGRKSALVRLSIEEDEMIAAYCRWDDCNYARVRLTWAEQNPAKERDGAGHHRPPVAPAESSGEATGERPVLAPDQATRGDSATSSPAMCHHTRTTDRPKYAIDDEPGHYLCLDCGDKFPLIGDTDEWKPKAVSNQEGERQ